MKIEKFIHINVDRNSKAIILYLFLLPIIDPLICTLILSINYNFLLNNGGYIVMLFPGIAGLIASMINRKQLSGLGLKFCPARFFAIGIVVPICCSIISYSIYWIFFQRLTFADFDFTPMTLLRIPIDLLFAFGEELGWRSFLTPAMTAKFGYIKASVFVGIIWGLWHGPSTIETNYYSGATVVFILGTVALSFAINYLRLKSKSVWPAVLVHGVYNYTESLLDSLSVGPHKVHWVGTAGIITVGVMAVIAIIFLLVHKKHPIEIIMLR